MATIEQEAVPEAQNALAWTHRAPIEASLDWLDRGAIAYLALPVLIFIVGWFKVWVAVPLVAILLIALRPVSAGARAPWAGRRMRVGVVAAVLIVALVWSALGGAGHLLFANFDWITRDTVLRDLVVGRWPVGYGEAGGVGLMLRAPIAYYLPAALVGKAFGLAAADAALLAWTVLGVSLFLGLAVARERRPPAIAIMLAVLVFFSGMDLVGTVLRGGWQLASHLQWTDHLEWWADRFQYSSHTTQLFWVPNHALPGWIATALLVRQAGRPNFIATLPVVVALLPLWSPLTAIGFLPLAVVYWLWHVYRQRSFSRVDWPALVAAMIVVVPISGYLVLNAGTIQSGATAGAHESLLFYVPHYLQFVLLEAGILWMLLCAVRVEPLLLTAGAVLLALPLFGFGPSNDLAMRGSIPALALLALAAARVCAHREQGNARKFFMPIVVVVVLGAPTAITEMIRAVTEPAWRPDYTHSLVPDPAMDFPTHYVTRLGDASVTKLFRPLHDVNERTLGSSRADAGAQR